MGLGYVYSVLWLIIAVMLFLRFRKENKVVYLLSFYFVFLSVWWFLDQFIPRINLMDGMYVWILRLVSAFVLCVSLLIYIKERKLPEDKSACNSEQNTAATTE